MPVPLFQQVAINDSPSSDQRQIADLLGSILLVIMFGCIIAAVLVPILTPERLARLVYIGFVFCVSVVAHRLSVRGYPRVASLVLLGLIWLIIMIASFTGGGLRSPTFTGGNMVIIAASGLLLGWQGAASFSILGSLTGLLMLINDRWLLLHVPVAKITSASLWIGSTVFYVMIALLFGIAIQRMKEALTEAQRNAQALRESEERFRVFMDTSPAIVIMKDTESRYVYANAMFEKFIGVRTQDAIGKSEYDIFPKAEAEQFVAGDREVLTSGKSMVLEYTAPTPGGLLRDWWVFKFPLTSPGGQKYVGVQVLDITDRKQMEREREGLIKDLETRNAELERFTYTVSHDLKSPLVTIRGFLGFLQDGIRTGNHARLQSDMDRIVEATNKMQRLLAGLLELSRIGRIAQQPQRVPFTEIALEALRLVEGHVAKQNTEITLDPNLPVVYVDRERLIEVLQNLLENATKFMGCQQAPGIHIGARSQPDGVPVFFVQDNGIGIEPQYHERVFGLFNKLDPTVEGTGIGLALVKRIIEVHGGKVWVESEGVCKGATFCFTLGDFHETF